MAFSMYIYILIFMSVCIYMYVSVSPLLCRYKNCNNCAMVYFTLSMYVLKCLSWFWGTRSCLSRKTFYYRPFHKTLPISSTFVNWISGRFYETGCSSVGFWAQEVVYNESLFYKIEFLCIQYKYLSSS